MAFPNQLNQEEVIQLANKVVPDFSITFEPNQYGGQFGDQEHLGGKDQFQHQQNLGFTQQNDWDGKHHTLAMQPQPLYHYPNCCCSSHWHHCCCRNSYWHK